MTVQIKKGKPIYAFSSENAPAVYAEPGEPVAIETFDCFEDQIVSEETDVDSIDWDRINPATGPVFIKGAEPGNTLAVHIDSIEVKSAGVLCTGKDFGTMGHRLNRLQFKIVPIKENMISFNERVKIPFNKMIGVIGVAPAEGSINCGTPGEHGGNMDTTLITEGTTLYLPVFHSGALFGLGDMHAAMGDGEIGVSGAEISGTATVRFDVLKNMPLNFPLISSSRGIALIASKETLDEAAQASVEGMIDFIHPFTNMDLGELTMLMSLIGDVQVSQIVDPKKTARFFVPRWFLNAYDIHL